MCYARRTTTFEFFFTLFNVDIIVIVKRFAASSRMHNSPKLSQAFLSLPTVEASKVLLFTEREHTSPPPPNNARGFADRLFSFEVNDRREKAAR